MVGHVCVALPTLLRVWEQDPIVMVALLGVVDAARSTPCCTSPA